RAVGQGRRRRMHPRPARAENAAVAANAVLLRKRDDHAAPGQMVAEDDGCDRVGDALLGAFDHVRRDVLVTTGCRVARQFRCLFRHRNIAWWFEGSGPLLAAKARADFGEMELPQATGSMRDGRTPILRSFPRSGNPAPCTGSPLSRGGAAELVSSSQMH